MVKRLADASEGSGRGRARARWRLVVSALGVALAFFALAHSLEDFAHQVPSERFGIDPTPAAVLLAAAFVGQGAVLALTWRGWWLGYLGSFVVGVAWLAAALLDHLGDLAHDDFREGVTSDALIGGIVVTALLMSLLSAWVLFGGRGGRTGLAGPEASEDQQDSDA